MKIIITGAKGMLGRDLVTAFAGAGHQVTGADLEEFDVRSQQAVEDFFAGRAAGACVHAAAFTDVDACEDDESAAMTVNAAGAANVSRACAARGIPIYYVSTDYVFSGALGRAYREEDGTDPVSAYGRSKLAGEEEVRAVNEEWCVARTCGLYGAHGRSFVATILAKARAGEALKVVNDQVVSPTWTVALAGALLVAVEGGARGVYHVACGGGCSWYDYAAEALRLSGLEGTSLTAISSGELARKAMRPAYSALDCSKFAREFGQAMPSWQEALAGYIKAGG